METDAPTTPPPTGPAQRAPVRVYAHLVATLLAALPAPLTDTPDHWADRDANAVEQIIGLAPATLT